MERCLLVEATSAALGFRRAGALKSAPRIEEAQNTPGSASQNLRVRSGQVAQCCPLVQSLAARLHLIGALRPERKMPANTATQECRPDGRES